MNKYLMNGAALLGTALLAVSCSHDAWFQTSDAAQRAAEEYSSNFKTVVLGDRMLIVARHGTRL